MEQDPGPSNKKVLLQIEPLGNITKITTPTLIDKFKLVDATIKRRHIKFLPKRDISEIKDPSILSLIDQTAKGSNKSIVIRKRNGSFEVIKRPQFIDASKQSPVPKEKLESFVVKKISKVPGLVCKPLLTEEEQKEDSKSEKNSLRKVKIVRTLIRKNDPASIKLIANKKNDIESKSINAEVRNANQHNVEFPKAIFYPNSSEGKSNIGGDAKKQSDLKISSITSLVATSNFKDTPLISKDKLNQMLKNAKIVDVLPESLKHGRFKVIKQSDLVPVNSKTQTSRTTIPPPLKVLPSDLTKSKKDKDGNSMLVSEVQPKIIKISPQKLPIPPRNKQNHAEMNLKKIIIYPPTNRPTVSLNSQKSHIIFKQEASKTSSTVVTEFTKPTSTEVELKKPKYIIPQNLFGESTCKDQQIQPKLQIKSSSTAEMSENDKKFNEFKLKIQTQQLLSSPSRSSTRKRRQSAHNFSANESPKVSKLYDTTIFPPISKSILDDLNKKENLVLKISDSEKITVPKILSAVSLNSEAVALLGKSNKFGEKNREIPNRRMSVNCPSANSSTYLSIFESEMLLKTSESNSETKSKKLEPVQNSIVKMPAATTKNRRKMQHVPIEADYEFDDPQEVPVRPDTNNRLIDQLVFHRCLINYILKEKLCKKTFDFDANNENHFKCYEVRQNAGASNMFNPPLNRRQHKKSRANDSVKYAKI